MRILLLSNTADRLDEGQRNVASHLHMELGKLGCQVRHVNASRVASKLLFRRVILAYRPHVIHMVFGLRPDTLLLGYLLSCLARRTPFVFSVLQPPAGMGVIRLMCHFVKPDLALVLSAHTRDLLRSSGVKTAFMECGVDLDRFRPVDNARKKQLRAQYGVRDQKPVVLHVGPLSRRRNLIELARRLPLDQVQFLVVGSSTFPADDKVLQILTGRGALVWHHYLQHIEEVYQLSDCYVFPTVSRRSCLELPLSVLEAMACNLAIITTPFGALPRKFPDASPGMVYVNTPSEIADLISSVAELARQAQTRTLVEGYTWDRVAQLVLEAYKCLQGGSVVGTEA